MRFTKILSFMALAYVALIHNQTLHAAPKTKKYLTLKRSQNRTKNSAIHRAQVKRGTKEGPKDRCVCVSIPKCGTHLFLKCLALFDPNVFFHNYEKEIKPSAARLAQIRKENQLPPPNHCKGLFHLPSVGPLPHLVHSMGKADSRKLHWTHWPYTKEFDAFLSTKTYANFLIVRDPRDMVVSFAFMVQKGRDGQIGDLSKIITDLITGKQEYYLPWAVEIQEAYPILWEKGLFQFYAMYFPWIQSKNFILLRFEDLIGAHGGGSAEAQRITIRSIGNHIGFKMSEEKVDEIIENLFGGTWTFREGQIGSWKKYFTPEIKETFQKDAKLMQLLIDFGYEKDKAW